MLQPANRGTPVSENITKIVRQHYKPPIPEPYEYEKVHCRTETTCQKPKPDDYWIENFHRRQRNLDKGFGSTTREPYRPIGGDLILDPYELVLSALPGNVERKYQPRMTRRGTVYEADRFSPAKSANTVDEETSICSQDLVDTCPSAGFDDIKKYLKKSRERMIFVKAGMPYEEHVKLSEDQARFEEECMRPDESGMVLQSLSTMCLPPLMVEDDDEDPHLSPLSDICESRPSTAASSKPASRTGSPQMRRRVLKIFDTCTGIMNHARTNRRRSSRSPALSSKRVSVMKHSGQRVSLAQVSSGITTALQRKERQFRDHFNFLKSICNILTALHNMRLRDIRSKVPLSTELVDSLQKEGLDRDRMGSRGTYTSKWNSPRKGGLASTADFRAGVACQECDTGSDSWGAEAPADPPAQRRAAWRTNQSRFGKNTRTSTATVDMDDENQINARMSVFGAVKRMNAFDNVGKNIFGRRRSRNPSEMIKADKQGVETWEDLLNVQPLEYKEDPGAVAGAMPGVGGSFLFQVGVVSKFMRWYRRASVTPVHASAPTPLPSMDTSIMSRLEEIRDKGLKDKEKETPERESYGDTHRTLGSAAMATERQRKLPIWQQVAQEKSTVYTNKKSSAPNHDLTIQRFKRDLMKLKRSLAKENTAELEKLVREKVASFRLKFSALSVDECSPLFEEQMYRVQQAKDKVNRTHMEEFDIQPSKWYEELREKSQIMTISFEQPQISEMMVKLQTYAHMDNKTVPYSKAKLCLLMMSLPAYDICQIHMQKALKFVFENILLGQEAQFLEWLNQRKIPYVVID